MMRERERERAAQPSQPPPNPPMQTIGPARVWDEDTIHPTWWRVLWCRLTGKHGGYVGHDGSDTYWQCANCTKRVR